MKVYGRESESDTGYEFKQEVSEIKVGIADYAVATNGSVLKTSGLGSCIGIALHDPETGIAGLGHVMLPTYDEIDDDNDAKFADTCISVMVEEMEQEGAIIDEVIAKIVGGSDMFEFSSNKDSVGDRNIESARRTLESHEIPIIAEDVGGDQGRSIEFEPSTGEVRIKSANREVEKI